MKDDGDTGAGRLPCRFGASHAGANDVNGFCHAVGSSMMRTALQISGHAGYEHPMTISRRKFISSSHSRSRNACPRRKGHAGIGMVRRRHSGHALQHRHREHPEDFTSLQAAGRRFEGPDSRKRWWSMPPTGFSPCHRPAPGDPLRHLGRPRGRSMERGPHRAQGEMADLDTHSQHAAAQSQASSASEGRPREPLGCPRALSHQGDRDTLYRIHGTNEPWSIGKAASSGCIRMLNEDVFELFGSVPVGARVVVR